MSEIQHNTDRVEERQKRIGLWASGVFSVLGLIFLIFWMYNVLLLQKGQADFSDWTLLPVTILMMGAGLGGYLLIQRNHLAAGLWLVFGIILLPPIIADLVFGNVYTVAIAYIAVFAPISIAWLLPKSHRRPEIIVTAAALLAIAAIELWHPAFRLTSIALENFAPYVIGLGGLSLVAFAIRQAIVGNIRTKLIVAFVLISVASAGIVASAIGLSMSTNLTNTIGSNLNSYSNSQAVLIAQVVNTEFNQLSTLALTRAVQERAANGTAANTLSPAEIQTLDLEWRAADAANNSSDPLVATVLNDSLSAELLKYQAQFPENVEVFLTDQPGVSLATTDRTSDYLQSDEDWWQVAYKNGQYIGQPEFDASTKTLAINMAVVVHAPDSNRIVGVLRTTVNINSLGKVLVAGSFGKTGRTEIYLPDKRVIKLSGAGTATNELTVENTTFNITAFSQSAKKFQTVSLDGIPSLASGAQLATLGSADKKNQVVNTLNWYVVVHQDQVDALQPVTTQTRNAIILSVLVILLAALAAFFLAQLLAGPIVRLNAAAQKVAAGDLTVQAKVESNDETGTLATTFNGMVSQLRDSIGTLESRVAERTQSLELAAEVGRSVSQVRALDVMFKEAAEIIRSRFDLYYVQVYLADPLQNALLLQSGTGTVGAELVGRSHRLPLDSSSINGRAAVEKHSVVITDTGTSATFRPNPLLPETRSEMAVPLMVGDNVVGVLDLQSRTSGSLSSELVPAFEALAGQFAIAIQNANLLAETEQARQEVEKQARRQTRANWTDYMDAIHTPEYLGFAFEGNIVTHLAKQDSMPADEGKTISAPIAVTGEALGSLEVELSEEDQTPQNTDLIQTVARQVAQQIESLRLLDSAERYRHEAEEATRRLTREGWKELIESKASQTSLNYMYDLEQVKPYNQPTAEKPGDMFLTLPVNVREEAIGSLAVQGISSGDSAAVDLVSAVAARLGAHIESLRQSDQTQSALAQSEKLFEASGRLTQATDLQDLLRVSVESLGIQAINRGVLGIFNYGAENELENMSIVANWWNGNGNKATEIGTTYPFSVFHTFTLFASPTPLFTNDAWNDSRVDGPTMELAKSQNFRAVAVLPLYQGTRQIGVLMLESETTHNFSQEEIRLFTAMAPQIATVLENRRQFERAQRQADRESTLNTIGQKIQSATSVEAVLQIAARELGRALGAPLTIAQLGMKDRN